MYPQVWTPRIGFASWLLSFAFFLHVFFIFILTHLTFLIFALASFVRGALSFCMLTFMSGVLNLLHSYWRLTPPSSMSLFFCTSFFDTLILRKNPWSPFCSHLKFPPQVWFMGFKKEKAYHFFKGPNWLASDCICGVLARIFGFNEKWPPVFGRACFRHAAFELFWWLLSWK